MELQVVALVPQEKKKIRVVLDNGESFLLYRGEIKSLSIVEGCFLTEDSYKKIIDEILGKRATKRAMYLLQRQERTEKQLRDKLQQSGYPMECIEQAISYVKSYHYIDDYRYASVYIRYHQEKESRQKLVFKLIMRGINREVIERALEEEYVSDEKGQIQELLRKRHYNPETVDDKEYRKTVQFLLRKGFKNNDIFRAIEEYSVA